MWVFNCMRKACCGQAPGRATRQEARLALRDLATNIYLIRQSLLRGAFVESHPLKKTIPAQASGAYADIVFDLNPYCLRNVMCSSSLGGRIARRRLDQLSQRGQKNETHQRRRLLGIS